MSRKKELTPEELEARRRKNNERARQYSARIRHGNRQNAPDTGYFLCMGNAA